MLSNWSYFMDNKYEKVRERCRKGIPPSLRGRAWKHLCGAAFHMEFSVNKHVFEVNNPSILLLYNCQWRNPKPNIVFNKNPLFKQTFTFIISEIVPCFQEVSSQPGDPRWVEDIKKDLNRQFPEHVMFSRSGPYGKGGYVLLQ